MVTDDYTVEVIDSIVGEEATRVWVNYDAAYRDYNLNSPVRESLREDDFFADMADSAFKKVVVRDHSGEIVGLAICTFDISLLPWMSDDFFRHNFPEDYGKILYLAGLYVSLDKRGQKASTPLMERLKRLCLESGGRMVGFDCSGKLQAWLAEVVMRLTNSVPANPHFESGEQERQLYYLLKEV